MKPVIKYTETDISDMKVIYSNDGNRQSTYGQKSFDDSCFNTQTGEYDNVRQDVYLNKPNSTSIANLMITTSMETFDSESFFPSRSGKSSTNSGFVRTSKAQLSHNSIFTHDINPHFKLNHNCVMGQTPISNVSSPILSKVRHGQIPVTFTPSSPVSMKKIYNKHVAQSFNDLHRKESFNLTDANHSPRIGLKSSYSMRKNILHNRDLSRTSQYDNVSFEDQFSLNQSTNSQISNNKSSNNGCQSKSPIQTLSRKMFQLDGFSKEDVAKQINKPTEYSQQLGKEYLMCFDFNSTDLVQSLRCFLSKITLHGETQERERILSLFSGRYFECNPRSFKSQDSCHTITCAVILLNTDLYGQNIGRKMNQNAFINNLRGLNDGEDFDPVVLKNVYQNIAKKPLPIEVSSSLKKQTLNLSGRTGNPITGMVFKRGFVMRKACLDNDGRRTPFGKRGWRMLYATLCEMNLFLHKDPNGFQKETLASLDELNSDSLRIHHSLASKPDDYQKKQFVFELKLANWAVYLFQASNEVECRQWIEAINLAAACFSAPPLPCGVGSQMTFRRPLLPTAPTKLSLFEQINEHENNAKKFEKEISEHHLLDDANSRDMENFEYEEKYYKFERARYQAYVDVLKKNYDKLKGKDRFQNVEFSQRMKLMPENNDTRTRNISSSLYPIRSSPAIIFETRV